MATPSNVYNNDATKMNTTPAGVEQFPSYQIFYTHSNPLDLIIVTLQFTINIPARMTPIIK